MEEFIKEGIKCIVDTFISDTASAKFEKMQDALMDKRHAKMFLQAVEHVGERYGREFIIPKDVLTAEMLQPGLSADALAERVQGVLDAYVLEGKYVEEDATIVRQICQEYLKSVCGDIENADVIKEFHTMREDASAEMYRLVEFCTRIEQALRKPTVANSSIEYQNLYKKALFWDDHITLNQVYMEPIVQNTEEKITKVLDNFLQDKDKYVLVIEGAPGIGKSSLLGMLADRFMHRPYYFLRLSDLGLQKEEELQSAISRLIATDECWKSYQKEGNVLFFDGFDEVCGKLTREKVLSFVKIMKRKGIKVVMTTRPEYWPYPTESYESIVSIKEYEYPQVKVWIETYLQLRGFGQDAIEQKIQQLEIRRERDKESGITNERIMDVLGIPIFLYIIYNKDIDLNEISSKTELYEDVFSRLLDDKSEEKPYAQEVAMCLGYFLQATEEPKFKRSMAECFQMLLTKNRVAIEESERCNLDAVLGNSFIRKISEGDEEREFYHKSIKDYFSAKYIMEKMEYCYDASEYASLIDKHDLREEIPHLQYYIGQKCEEDKELLGKLLQQNFLNALCGRMNASSETWCGGAGDKTHVSLLDIAERNRKMFENQMHIMHEIFQMPIVDEEEAVRDCTYAVAMVMSHTFIQYNSKETKEQFFWRTWRYLCLDADNIFRYIRQTDFASLFKADVTICDVKLRQLRHRFYKNEKLCFCMEDCVCENLDFVQGYFEKCTITRTRMWQLRLDVNTWREMQLTDSHISDSIFSCVAIRPYMKQVVYQDCTFRAGKLIGGKYEQVTFEECTFVDFIFIGIKNVSSVLFKECKFINVTFDKCKFIEENFVDCNMFPIQL